MNDCISFIIQSLSANNYVNIMFYKSRLMK